MLLVYVTYPRADTAQRTIKHLLEKKLIACGVAFPVDSQYLWKSKVTKSREVVVLLKTRKSLAKRLENDIIAHHPYETPCILRISVKANKAYDAWLKKTVVTKRARR